MLSPQYYKVLQDRFRERRNGFQDLHDEIAQTKSEYIIAGDFNSTMAMGKMQSLTPFHIDSQRYDINFLPTTFRILGLRLWRLDYFFIRDNPDRNVHILSHKQVDTSHLSDHTGIMVTLLLN